MNTLEHLLSYLHWNERMIEDAKRQDDQVALVELKFHVDDLRFRVAKHFGAQQMYLEVHRQNVLRAEIRPLKPKKVSTLR